MTSPSLQPMKCLPQSRHTLPPSNRLTVPYARYFTLTHLYNAGEKSLRNWGAYQFAPLETRQ